MTKDLNALIKAYAKQHPIDVVFRNEFKVVGSNTVLQSLTTRSPDFVAMEAVKISDLASRNNSLQPERKALRDVTNSAEKTPVPEIKGRASQIRSTPTPSRPVTMSPASSHATPTGHHTTTGKEEINAWTDFVYERRIHQERTTHSPKPTVIRLREANEAIQAEWDTLNKGQKSYFEDRAKKVAVACQNSKYYHRAFWCFYYEVYFQRKTANIECHQDFQSTQAFTTEIINAWQAKPLRERMRFVNSMSTNFNLVPVPEVPLEISGGDRSTFQPAAVSLSASIKNEAERSASPRPSVKEEVNPLSPLLAATPSSSPLNSQDCEPEREAPSTNLNMTELFTGRTPEQLEKSVDRGVEMLQEIRKTLESQPSQDATQWLQTIANVEKQAVRTKTVVGVVGATGAGKSSVINAMLDEERLVPTNCMRACTAVVTEISYNHEDIRYRAEIEFIARQDWAKELRVLFQDLIDGSGEVSRECTNEESDAGIAYAKIRAVYPKLTKEDMKTATIERLMDHINVSCLGTERKIENEDSLMFYRKLQHYVDSKEKSTSKDKDKEKGPREMEFWPLIKVVRLYVKAPALATGAVIVDLPGVHDSNQARAAVAQNYMKACTGLWIVAPITRAVDDKSAKTLLGDSFKRQLKMDGGYSSVTFICSKTDDISLTEAQDSLGLEEEMGHLYAKFERLRKTKKGLQNQMQVLKDTKGDISAAMETADEELEMWEKLQEDQNEGVVVYAPTKLKSTSKKRKRSGKTSTPRKKSKYVEPDTDDEFIDDGSDRDSDAGSYYSGADSEADRGEPLTEDHIILKIAELRAAKKAGRSKKFQVDEQIKAMRKEIAQLDSEQEVIDAELSARCISGRNEYSRSAIQKDFASGIRELDQELAEEEDAANFDPEADARDYEEVARSLKVFCVSSRAYQKLKGRLLKDKAVPGFKNVDETEIPKLQAHCQKLTEAGREAACKRFLTNLVQVLNSLRLWSSNDGSGRNLTDSQLKREAKILNEKLDRLDIVSEPLLSVFQF